MRFAIFVSAMIITEAIRPKMISEQIPLYIFVFLATLFLVADTWEFSKKNL